MLVIAEGTVASVHRIWNLFEELQLSSQSPHRCFRRTCRRAEGRSVVPAQLWIGTTLIWYGVDHWIHTWHEPIMQDSAILFFTYCTNTSICGNPDRCILTPDLGTRNSQPGPGIWLGSWPLPANCPASLWRHFRIWISVTQSVSLSLNRTHLSPILSWPW